MQDEIAARTRTPVQVILSGDDIDHIASKDRPCTLYVSPGNINEHVVRAVVDWKGQIVTMADRAYLTEAMPMLIIWGSDDRVIPVKHAGTASTVAPSAVVEVLPNSGHFPHKDHPERFTKIVNDFIRSTQPASYHRGRWRQLLRNGPATPLSEHAELAEVTPIRKRRAGA